ncbi:MAG: hypothetical protein JWM60_1703 [Solirubrobacterales bacterium]|nr:hypothetical protein [Solirubrobacterales bacterium]
MIDRIAWLHVSDFHFRSRGDRFSETVACNALLADLTVRAQEHGPIAFVLVSGDIAYSGQPLEYERAAKFLSELSARISVATSRFFFIPGNHDVDRAPHRFAQIGARHVLTSQQAVDQALGDPVVMADLADRQRAYRAFVEGFASGQERTATPDGLGYVAKVQLEALTVAVAGMNSAWLCGGESEEKTLIIGERQVIAALEIVGEIDPQLVVAMAHHPLEWLTEWDQASCRSRLLEGAHFLHRGHLHTADVATSPQRKCVLVAAGSAHGSRFHPNSYNIVTVDLATGSSAVAEYRYNVEDGEFAAEPVIRTPCDLGGEIPGTGPELSAAIAASAPEASPFAGYMAALLLGEKEEIPLEIDGAIMFVTSSMAHDSDAEQAAPALAFLGLRNLLRIRREGVALGERVREHAEQVIEFAAWLEEKAEKDEQCRRRVSDVAAAQPAGEKAGGGLVAPHTALLLRELAAEEDWDALELQAGRALNSSDPALAQLGRRMIAMALMHSDEAPKRAHAAVLAQELIDELSVGEDEYLLAAGAFEVNNETARAVAATVDAVHRWPASARVVSYARDLATRTGDVPLRDAITKAREDYDNG